jgi:hypothetical protein
LFVGLTAKLQSAIKTISLIGSWTIFMIVFVVYIAIKTETTNFAIKFEGARTTFNDSKFCDSLTILEREAAIVKEANYNSELMIYKYWQANPWTSWFYSNQLDYLHLLK